MRHFTTVEILSGQTGDSSISPQRQEYFDHWARLETDTIFAVTCDRGVTLRIFWNYFRTDPEAAQEVVNAQDARYAHFPMKNLRWFLEPFQKEGIVLRYRCAKQVLEEKL